MASFFRMDGWIKTAQGPAIPGAQIYVCTQPANTLSAPPSPLASIFSDVNGLSPVTQPLAADGFGHYDFYALAGAYTVVVVIGGLIQQVYPDQSLGGGSSSGGTALVLEVNGIQTVNQMLQNLAGAGNVTVAADVLGNTTIIGKGIPVGGTTGQVLTKINGTDYNTLWATPPSTVLSGNGAFFIGPGITSLASAYTNSIGSGTFNSSAGVVQAFLFELEAEFVVNKVSIEALGNQIGVNCYFGIYNFAGTKLVDGGSFLNLTGSGVQTTTLGAPVTLPPGTYWHAQATNTSSVGQFPAVAVSNNPISAMLTKNATRAAVAANPVTGGGLPATLGALTPFTPSGGSDSIFCPLYE